MQTESYKDKFKNEHKLLEGLRKAENTTISYFYKTYLPGVINYITHNGGVEDDARDIFREALLVLYKKAKAGDFKLTASLKTYVFSICRYQWLNSRRKTKKVDFLGDGIDLIDLDMDVIRQIERAEKFRLLQSHLSKLNPSERQILKLHFQKYSTEEIADQLGLSKLYVKKMKYLSKKKLIDSIKKDQSKRPKN